MNYPEWLATIPKEFTDDALWRMEVYRLALFAGDVAWFDVTRLMQDRRTLGLSSQLYEAMGSISANISEGYSRSSHKDQARFYEYSLGSARESRNWYWKGRHVLTDKVAMHRIQLLTQIVRHLLNVIPAQRGHTLHEDSPPYFVSQPPPTLEELLANIPVPPPTYLTQNETRNTRPTMPDRPITIATRGSALALAQTNLILAQCRNAFPELQFDFQVIKTTGDKLQTASMSKTDPSLPKGLFTKELEVALLNGQADLAVHSLKDLPTELPDGLILAATPERADVRDVLIYRAAGQREHRGFQPHAKLTDFPKGAAIATSSTRRAAQLKLARPDLNIVEIRGNVTTRMSKVAERAELDATVLALAGISRLNFTIATDGKLTGDGVPDGLLATVIDVETMLPCVGQGAIGIEIRANDECLAKICERLNHYDTFQAVTAERAFLRGMGGGCQSPVAAYAEIVGDEVTMRAVSFRDGPSKRTEGKQPVTEAATLGEQLAVELR